MKLYFVRHGQAESRDTWPQAQDHLRPLSEDGVRRMHTTARTFRKLGLQPAAILTSPLIRARQTADIVAEALGCEIVEEESLEPGFGLTALKALLQRHADAEALMLVGHEPDFSSTVEGLISGGRLVVKKGSLIRVDLFSLNPPRGELIWLIPPKVLTL